MAPTHAKVGVGGGEANALRLEVEGEDGATGELAIEGHDGHIVGGDVNAPTLDGKVMIRIPAGTQNATVFKIRGKGVPSLSSGGQRGDLMIRVLVEVPTKLDGDQRAKLEEFAALCGDENTPLHQSFFEKAKAFFR